MTIEFTECQECGEDAEGFDLCATCSEALDMQESIDAEIQCDYGY